MLYYISDLNSTLYNIKNIKRNDVILNKDLLEDVGHLCLGTDAVLTRLADLPAVTVGAGVAAAALIVPTTTILI